MSFDSLIGNLNEQVEAMIAKQRQDMKDEFGVAVSYPKHTYPALATFEGREKFGAKLREAFRDNYDGMLPPTIVLVMGKMGFTAVAHPLPCYFRILPKPDESLKAWETRKANVIKSLRGMAQITESLAVYCCAECWMHMRPAEAMDTRRPSECEDRREAVVFSQEDADAPRGIAWYAPVVSGPNGTHLEPYTRLGEAPGDGLLTNWPLVRKGNRTWR